jgi:hypothetical protein
MRQTREGLRRQLPPQRRLPDPRTLARSARYRASTAQGADLPVPAESPIHGRRADSNEFCNLAVGAACPPEPDDDAADLRGRWWSHDHRRSRSADRIKRVRR